MSERVAVIDCSSGEYCDGCHEIVDIFVSIPSKGEHPLRLCRNCDPVGFGRVDFAPPSPPQPKPGDTVLVEAVLVKILDRSLLFKFGDGTMCWLGEESIHPAPTAAKKGEVS